MSNFSSNENGYSSPPCFAHELEISNNGYSMVDLQTTIEVARWRKAKRAELIAARLKIAGDERRYHAGRVVAELEKAIDFKEKMTVGVYWPVRGEVDLRYWMRDIFRREYRVALPVVVEEKRPIRFRVWDPGARMKLGLWNIPIPAGKKEAVPDVVIAPVVGFDPNCYRLGYGGGYYDCTLVSYPTRPKIIEVGHPCGALKTIFPQPHDIPMDFIVIGEQ